MNRVLRVACILCLVLICAALYGACSGNSGLSLAVNAPESDWLFIEVLDGKGRKVYAVTVADLGGEKDLLEKPDSIAGRPARIYPNRAIWLWVRDRFRIHIDADPGEVPEYRDTEKMKAFALLFDFDGLEKVRSEEKLKSRELRRYMPRLRLAGR